MLNIHPKYYLDRPFISLKNDTGIVYTCTGTGHNGNDGSNYFTAQHYDSDLKGHLFTTHLLKDVCFIDSPEDFTVTKQTICG